MLLKYAFIDIFSKGILKKVQAFLNRKFRNFLKHNIFFSSSISKKINFISLLNFTSWALIINFYKLCLKICSMILRDKPLRQMTYIFYIYLYICVYIYVHICVYFASAAHFKKNNFGQNKKNKILDMTKFRLGFLIIYKYYLQIVTILFYINT